MTITDDEIDAADEHGRDVAAAVAQLLNDLDCPPAVAMIALTRVIAGVLSAMSNGDPRGISQGADLCDNAIRTYAGNYAAEDAAGPLQ